MALWSPRYLAPSCWWDAQEYESLAFNGSKISQIDDQSGNNYHATNSTDSSRPTYTPDGLNGHPAFRFAEGQRIGNTTRNITGVASVFYVQRTTDNQYIILGENTTARYLFIGNSADTTSAIQGGVGQPQRYWKNGEPQNWFSRAGIYTALHNQSAVVSATNTDFSVWTGGLWLSGYNHSTWTFAGDIGEFIVVPGYISQADTDRVHGYLAHKWGLADQLPADHPYKLAPPTIDLTGRKIIGGEVFDIKGSDGKYYRTHTFKASQSIEVLEAVNAEVLLVGGGGGGGKAHTNSSHGAGGGGAGGVVKTPIVPLAVGLHVLTVGTGGNTAGSTGASSQQTGENGDDTVAFGYTAIGGGGGSNRGANTNATANTGRAGGSGGGGADDASTVEAAGLQPASASGGFGTDGARFSRAYLGTSNRMGGPGGGAGESGPAAVPNGGDGLYVGSEFGDHIGVDGFVAGGGGGGASPSYGGYSVGGVGGGGGSTSASVHGQAGINGTGGGGGGGRASSTANGGRGGDGVLVIRYEIEQPDRGIGGEVSYIEIDDTPYVVHTFRRSGKFHATQDMDVEYLVVGGGGGGGTGSGGFRGGGGGGAGGVLEGEGELPAGEIDVVVGKGGHGRSDSANTNDPGGSGENSSIGEIATATGGGGGGSTSGAGSPGGSGGGSPLSTVAAGEGVAGQGHDGGRPPGSGSHSGGGGGGGAGEPGHNPAGSSNSYQLPNGYGADGGDGIQSDITGVLSWYGGGGGGGNNNAANTTTHAAGEGGKGGGGNAGRRGHHDAQPGIDSTGGGGGASSTETRTSAPGGDGIVILRYVASWAVHSGRHTHTASGIGKLLTEIHSADTTHAITSTTPTFLFRPHSARQKHHARWHLFRMDFVYDQVHHDVFAGSMRFDFGVGTRPVSAHGFTLHPDLKYGTPEIRNLAQAFYPVGLQGDTPLRYGVSYVGFREARINLTFRSAPDDPAELPLLFDFQEGNDALPIHNARQYHVTTQCNVGVRIPLVTQSASQAQTAEHTRVVLPVRAESSQHKQHSDQVRVALPIHSADTTHIQTATQPALVHTSPLLNLSTRHVQTAEQVWVRSIIHLTGLAHSQLAHTAQHTSVVHRPPARAHSVVHHHRATNVVVTHITPLVINKGTQIVASDQVVIRNWVGVIPADARQVQTAPNLVLYVWAALILADTRHLHRSMRLNFLPADWIFRQVIEIEFDDRGFVLDPEERAISLEPEVREGVLPPEDRTLTIPPEIRTVELESIGRASSVER